VGDYLVFTGRSATGADIVKTCNRKRFFLLYGWRWGIAGAKTNEPGL